MCEIGMRVQIRGAIDEVGKPVPDGGTGMVIGHLGRKWAIISLDGDPGRTVLVREGSAVPMRGTRSTAVVVQPSGKASALSRKDTERVRVRTPR